MWMCSSQPDHFDREEHAGPPTQHQALKADVQTLAECLQNLHFFISNKKTGVLVN